MRVVVVTGMSGSGKSVALRALEDAGYYAIDNLPVALFDTLAAGYLAGCDWEPPEELVARAASLLPALFLARVDGKSPVEYITTDETRAAIRRVARPLVATPPSRLATIRDAWREDLTAWRPEET